MSSVTVGLPAETLERVRAEARRDDDTVGEWIARAVADKLQRRTPGGLARRPTQLGPCRKCDTPAKPGRRGLCEACYQRERRKTRKLAVCVACQFEGALGARGLCLACYNRDRRSRLCWCRGCRQYARHVTTGLCDACYQQARRAAQKERTA